MLGNSMKNTHNLLSNTNLLCRCMRINYTASILFPFDGLIFGKHSTVCFAQSLFVLFSALFLLHYFSMCFFFCAATPHTLPLSARALSSNFHIKQTNRFVEMLPHLNEQISNVEHWMIAIFKTYYVL